ncbi:uncharacterized protein J3D65DRAFT_607654 [Phyllosticta citribraziliensis]|uniref:Uncharacterized protein n=1 Tax=Phyllosticta citribraziliensis TaxID=989973 RepID=A0ABR1L5K3_9PEZI
MPNATDLITYIGVPLTVLGIFPILLNIAKAGWIWYRLSKSIPRELRPFYNLIADPANGNVTVVARTLICAHPGLWARKKTDEPSSLERVKAFKRWFRSAITAVFPGRTMSDEIELLAEEGLVGESDTSSRTSLSSYASTETSLSGEHIVSIKPRTIRLRSGKLLRPPWMEAASTLGFDLKRKPHTHFDAMRFIVNSSLETKTPPPLAMRWSDFVWFSLAVGIDAMELALISNGRVRGFSFKDAQNETMMILSNEGHDWHVDMMPDYHYLCSIRRALAWFETMCFDLEEGQPYCRRLGNHSVLSSEHFFGRFRHEPQTFEDQLSAAVTWISYNGLYLKSLEAINISGRQSSENKSQEDLFVSQRLLETQERSLCFLQKLDNEGSLNGILQSLFFRPDFKSPDGMLPGPVVANAILIHLRMLFASSEYVKTSQGIANDFAELATNVRSREIDSTMRFLRRELPRLKRLREQKSPDDSPLANLVRYVIRNCEEYRAILEAFDPIFQMDARLKSVDPHLLMDAKQRRGSGTGDKNENSKERIIPRESRNVGGIQSDSPTADQEQRSNRDENSMRGNAMGTDGIEIESVYSDMEESSGPVIEVLFSDKATSEPENKSTDIGEANSLAGTSFQGKTSEVSSHTSGIEVESIHSDEAETGDLKNESVQQNLYAHIFLALQEWGAFPRTTWEFSEEFASKKKEIDGALWGHNVGLADLLEQAADIARSGVYAAPRQERFHCLLDHRMLKAMVYLH